MAARQVRRARLASRIAGAALLGAATILVPKADPTEHWATPVEIVAAVESEQAPDPDEPLPGGAVIAWPAGLSRT
jgi:hypothetical protein